MSAPAGRKAPLALEGDLTLTTVSTLFESLTPRVMTPGRPAEIDLAGIGRVDSAGLALLLEWRAMAAARGATLHLLNAPSDLHRLAGLSEATGPLGLEPDDAQLTELNS